MEKYTMEEVLLDKVYEYRNGCPVCGRKNSKEGFETFLEREDATGATDEKVITSCKCGYLDIVKNTVL